MGDPLKPDPRSPEGRMIAYAIERGYLKQLELEEARIKLSGHPAGREPGALLRLLRSRYLSPAHLDELRRYYQQTKAEILRAAEEAQLEVLSISDILVGKPFSISDTGEVEVVELDGAALPAAPAPVGGDPVREPPPPHAVPDGSPADEPMALVPELPEPARAGAPRWLIPLAVVAVIAVAAVVAWLNAG